jgi:hypothetical protein
VVNGQLYCVGGVDSAAEDGMLTCPLYVLDHSSAGEASWRALLIDLPADIGACHAVAFHDELVVAPHGKHVLFMVDVSGSCACREVDLVHTRVGTTGLVVVEDALYRLHGDAGHLQISPVEHKYSSNGQMISSTSSVLADSSANAVAVHGSKIYVFGKYWDTYDVRTGQWTSAYGDGNGNENSSGRSATRGDRRVPSELHLNGAAVLYPGSSFNWN